MGLGKILECPKCGNKIALYEGIGMMWSSFDKEMFYPPKEKWKLNFYDGLDKKMIKEIHNFIEESKEVFVPVAYYQPYICKKCGKIESKVYFRIENENKTYSPKYTCKCGNKYKLLTQKDIENLRCDKCNKGIYDVQEFCWD